MKKVTSQDVARLAGVSQSTVSMVLNNKANISFSDETRDRVFSAARSLNYRLPSQTAAVQKPAPPLIAVFIPTLSNHYYSHLLQAIEDSARQKGYKVIFCNTARVTEQENYYLDLCRDINVSGIIFTFVPSFPRRVENLAHTIPTVLIGEKTDSVDMPSIELSNTHSGALVADHLLELGHRDIAVLSTPCNSWTLARTQRIASIQARLAERCPDCRFLSLESDQEEWDVGDIPYEYAVGRSLTRALLREHPEVTALVGINDMVALGILSTLREAGARVPEDFSVCGFDNIFSTQLPDPQLTTVDHHLGLRAASSVDMVTSSDQETVSYRRVNKIEYQPQLIVRGSTGPCRTSTLWEGNDHAVYL